jgi:Ni2+-binding GTPase involved in maturation of urease and hydrogenase
LIKFVALSGFLGAGKTTTLMATARALEEQGRRVAVVTNDQGTDLVDTQLVRSALDRVAQVTGGCFCCRFEDLLTVVETLLERNAADTVIAEAVGSCTDLQATVVRPLRKYYGDRFSVAPLTTVVDPGRLRGFTAAARRGEPESDLSYLFAKQLTEADIIAVNKVDRLADTALDRLVSELTEAYPNRRIVPYSAKTGAGLDALIQAWDGVASWAQDLDIDYDRYAAAEAQLAWLNLQLNLQADATAGFDPAAWASAALEHLAKMVDEAGAEIGHAKIAIATSSGLIKASVTERGAKPTLDVSHADRVASGLATVNARVACEPTDLDRWVQAAIEHANAATGAVAAADQDAVAFKPGYPAPQHQILSAQM